MAIQYFDIPVYTYHRSLATTTSADIPLVLIHAFPVDHHVWDYAVPDIIAQLGMSHDTTILAVDMPGAGANPIPPMDMVGVIADDGAYEEAMDRMASSIVHAVQSRGYERAIYAGISMGGYATLSIARQFPEAMAGMALCDTKADADTPELRVNRLAAADLAERESTLAPVVHFAKPQEGDSAFKKSAEFIDTFMGWINAQTPTGIAWRQRMAAGRRDDNDTLETITVPTAVISGTLDGSSNPSVMRPLAGKISHAHVTFTQINDAGHFTCFEKPAEVAHALVQLVNEVRDIANQNDDSRVSSRSLEFSGFESLRQGQVVECVPLTEGHIDYKLNVREKITMNDWESFLGDDNARIILVHKGLVAVAKNGIHGSVTTGHKRHLVTLPGAYLSQMLTSKPDGLYFLGEVKSSANHKYTYIACNLSEYESQVPSPDAISFVRQCMVQYDWLPLREVAHLLSADEAQLVTMTMGLSMWHRKAQFCGYCGSAVHNINGGWATRCVGEDRHINFPRIEPAMIVRITDENDRILLQHNHAWADGVYSVCSGFVEVGENAEDSVHREVMEELGIEVKNVHYVGSQPWPFPGSLMLGFGTQAVDTELTLDTREVADARWMTRDELMRSIALGEIELPGHSSIALTMIEQWYGAKLR